MDFGVAQVNEGGQHFDLSQSRFVVGGLVISWKALHNPERLFVWSLLGMAFHEAGCCWRDSGMN